MIEAHGHSDPGRKRKNNEDSFAVEPAVGLVVVADGMGGHQSGEVASGLAVEALREFVVRATRDADLTWPFGLDAERSFAANCLATGIKLANRRVYREAALRDSLAGMGTTLVAALIQEDRLTYAGVGDSRAYLLRGGSLRQLTRDDSWVEAAVAQHLIAPRERESHPFRHVLTKAVGLQEDVEFESGEETLEEDDRIVLCSDGLHSVVSEDEIRDIVEAHPEDLRAACLALVAAANAGGGPDNVTAVVARAAGRS
jgi:protein phosphatase